MGDKNTIKMKQMGFEKADELKKCDHWIHHLRHCTFYTAKLNSYTQAA